MSVNTDGQTKSVPLDAVTAVLPAAAATAAGLAAGAAFVGGVVLVQVGRGLMACGRKADQAIRAHAAKQEAIYRQCREYEERLVAAAGRSSTRSRAAQDRQRLLKTIAQRHQVARRPVPPLPFTEVQADVLAGERPALDSYGLHTVDTQKEEAGRLAARADGLQKRLEALQSEQWQGLVDTGGLAEELAAIRQGLQGAGSAAGASLYDLERRLGSLEAEVGFRMQEGYARQKERQETAAALQRAATTLAQLTQRAEPPPADALAVGQEVLAHADSLYARGDLDGAREMARAAETYLGQLAVSLEGVRRANLEVAIASLRETIDGYGFAEDDPAPRKLRGLIEAAERELKAGRLEECWQELQRAQVEVDKLTEEVRWRSQAVYRSAAFEVARKTLEEMGYRGVPDFDPEGTVRLRATHEDGTAFVVEITAEGTLRYKTEGFDDLRCHDAAARFFDGLRKKGMQVDLHSEFNMLAAARRVREALLHQGYDLVEERADEEGRFIELTASRKGGQTRKVEVRNDGAIPEDLAESQSAQSSQGFLTDYWRQWWLRDRTGRVKA